MQYSSEDEHFQQPLQFLHLIILSFEARSDGESDHSARTWTLVVERSGETEVPISGRPQIVVSIPSRAEIVWLYQQHTLPAACPRGHSCLRCHGNAYRGWTTWLQPSAQSRIEVEAGILKLQEANVRVLALCDHTLQ